MVWFPSPLGEIGLSIRKDQPPRRRLHVSVPSRGNRVIDCTWAFFARVNGIVSVPSRGNRVIDTAIITMQAIAATQVSVPSRGNRVIDSIDNASSAC